MRNFARLVLIVGLGFGLDRVALDSKLLHGSLRLASDIYRHVW